MADLQFVAIRFDNHVAKVAEILHIHGYIRGLAPCPLKVIGLKHFNNKKLSCCCDSRSYRVQIRSPHTSARHRYTALQWAVSAHVSAVAPNGTVPTRGPTNAVTCVLGLRCASFFVVRFMSKRYILDQKCQKGQIGTLMLGTRWYNF